jgi:hypothetical protein
METNGGDPGQRAIELVDAGEIARRLRLRHRNVVLDWRFHRFHFPAPVTRRRSYLWNWTEVAEWAAVHATELQAHQVREPEAGDQVATPPR